LTAGHLSQRRLQLHHRGRARSGPGLLRSLRYEHGQVGALAGGTDM